MNLHAIGKKGRIVVLVGILSIVIAGCAPTPVATGPWPEVTYSLTGVCVQSQYDPSPGTQPCVGGDANITIENSTGGTEQSTVTFPYELRFIRAPGEFVYISGQLQGGGTVTCQITSGGRQVQYATSSGEFSIATCSGQS